MANGVSYVIISSGD